MPKLFKPNEVYTDIEKNPDASQQLLMWIDVISIVKQGIVDGNISIKTLQNKYQIKKK